MLKMALQLLAETETKSKAIRGLDILISIGTTAIGGQRNGTISTSSNVIDVSNKNSGDWVENISGAKDWGSSLDGLYYVDDEGQKAAIQAYLKATEVDVKVAKGESAMFTGKALITSLDIDAPYDDAATYSMELTGTGALAFTGVTQTT